MQMVMRIKRIMKVIIMINTIIIMLMLVMKIMMVVLMLRMTVTGWPNARNVFIISTQHVNVHVPQAPGAQEEDLTRMP